MGNTVPHPLKCCSIISTPIMHSASAAVVANFSRHSTHSAQSSRQNPQTVASWTNGSSGDHTDGNTGAHSLQLSNTLAQFQTGTPTVGATSHTNGFGAPPLAHGQSLHNGAGHLGASSSQMFSSELQALSEVTDLPVATIIQIASLLEQENGRAAMKEEIFDTAEEVLKGSRILPPVHPPPPAQADRDEDSGSHLSIQSEASCDSALESEEDLSESEEEQMEENARHQNIEIEDDTVDGTCPVQPARIPVASLLDDHPHDSGIHRSSLNVAEEVLADSEMDPPVAAPEVVVSKPSGAAENVGSDSTAQLWANLSEEEQKRRQVTLTLLAVKTEFQILDAARKCNNCKVKARDTTFLPCGHFMMCRDCSEPVLICPACNKTIQATVQTFLS